MKGFRCDASNADGSPCQEMTDGRIFTVTIDLGRLPQMRGLQVYVALRQEGLIDISDARYMEAMNALQGEDTFSYGLPQVEVDLCPGHGLTALTNLGVIDLGVSEDEPTTEVETDV